MQIRPRNLPLALLCAALLSACGGGGSSGSSSSTPPVAATPVITSANFTSVAAQAWAGSDVFNSGSATGGGASQPISVSNQVNDILGKAQASAQQLDVLERSFSESCPGGGSLTAGFKLTVARSLTPGAKLDISGVNCNINSVNLDGKLSLQIAQGSGTNLDLLFTNLSLSSSNEKITLDGDAKINQANGLRTTSGNRLRLVFSRNGTQVLDQTLSNFSYSQNTLGTGEGSRVTGTLTSQSSSLGTVSMNLQTNQAFVGASNGNPQSGVMTVSAGTSTIKLTALEGNKVRVDFSANGDATINQTQTLTWDEFKSKK